MADFKDAINEAADNACAVLVNQCAGQMDESTARLSFLEASPSGIRVRAAVCMSTDNAIEMYRMLGQLIAGLTKKGKVN